ncbi:MAG TPA: hypothetical protein VF519_15000 [Mycobacteriales bacterium]
MTRLLAAAALAALLAAGCADDPEPRTYTPVQVYDAAVAAGTARITITVTADEVAPGIDAGSTGNGVADLKAGTAAVRVEFSGYAFEQPGYESVSTADRVYLRTTGEWVTFRAKADERGVLAVPTLPLQRLRDVREWSAVGEEEVGGRDTRHYRGRTGDTAQQVDAWVGADGRPVRVDLAGDPKAHLAFRLDLRDYGAAADVTVPAGAKEVRDFDAAFKAVGLL